MTQENKAKQLAEEAIAYYSNFIIHLLVCRTLAIHLYQEKKKSCPNIPCENCTGHGYTMEIQMVCCQNPIYNGSCCGDGDADYEPVQCGQCNGMGQLNPEYQLICEVIKYLETLLT